MKTNQFLPLMAALLMAPSALLAQNTATTTPVGYVSQTIPANVFTFCGLTVHSSITNSGVISSADSSSVTVNGVNFSTLLTAGATYILELDNGTIQEITSWDSTGKLNTPENISAQITNGVTSFNLRKAKTIDEVFGSQNKFGFKSTNSGFETADQIFLPTSQGLVTVYYYDDGSEKAWYTASGDLAGSLPLVYSDGFYIKRQAGDPITFVVDGEIKPKPTSGVITPGWNFLSSVYPVGLTLSQSGLQNFLTKSSDGSFDTVDNVYIPTANGFETAYFYDDGSEANWYTVSGNLANDLKIEGAFLILSRAASAKAYKLNIPTP